MLRISENKNQIKKTNNNLQSCLVIFRPNQKEELATAYRVFNTLAVSYLLLIVSILVEHNVELKYIMRN